MKEIENLILKVNTRIEVLRSGGDPTGIARAHLSKVLAELNEITVCNRKKLYGQE